MLNFESVKQAIGYYNKLSWNIENEEKQIKKFKAKGITPWRREVLKNMYTELNKIKDQRDNVREWIEYFNKHGVVKPLEKSQSSLISFRK